MERVGFNPGAAVSPLADVSRQGRAFPGFGVCGLAKDMEASIRPRRAEGRGKKKRRPVASA